MRIGRLLLPLILASLTLTGCGALSAADSLSGPATKLPSLPILSADEALRDEVARVESAIEQSAETLGSLATECGECEKQLDQVAADANERLTIVGGLWEPWTDVQSGQVLPEPPEVADAPLTPRRLVGYMVTTSQNQLDQVSKLRPEGAPQLLGVIGGRLSSAMTLAQYYEVDWKEAAGEMDRSEVSTSVGAPLEAQSGMPVDDSDPDVAAKAAVAFDCLATASGQTSLTYDDLDRGQAFYDLMIARSDSLAKMVDTDPRPLRCTANADSVDTIMQHLLGTDIALMTSQSLALRELGKEFFWDDLAYWHSLGGLPRTIVGVTES